MTNTTVELDPGKTANLDLSGANLLPLAQQALGGDFSRLAGQFLGESQSSIQSALTSLLPAVLGGIAQKGATPEGASSLMSMINGANLDVNSLGNPAGLFGGSGSGIKDLLKSGTSRLVPALLGDKSGAVVNALSSVSGIKSSSATNLIAMVVPLILTFLKKFIGDKGLNASSLASLLGTQGPNLQSALDSRLAGALGFASPAATLRGQATAMANRAGAAVGGGASAAASTATAATTATKSALMRWLPWLIGAAALLFVWYMFSGKQASAPASAPAPTAAAPASTPTPMLAAVTISLPAKVYFEVGSAVVGADASKTISAIADMIKKDDLKVAITGYTDKTGDAATNEALAKSRATAVRDALKAAGATEANMEMKPPLFVEAGAGGSDAEARRVEINNR